MGGEVPGPPSPLYETLRNRSMNHTPTGDKVNQVIYYTANGHLLLTIENGPQFALTQQITLTIQHDIEWGIECLAYRIRWKQHKEPDSPINTQEDKKVDPTSSQSSTGSYPHLRAPFHDITRNQPLLTEMVWKAYFVVYTTWSIEENISKACCVFLRHWLLKKTSW